MFDVDNVGYASTSSSPVKLWDEEFTASDKRSRYLGKGEMQNVREGAQDSWPLVSLVKKILGRLF